MLMRIPAFLSAALLAICLCACDPAPTVNNKTPTPIPTATPTPIPTVAEANETPEPPCLKREMVTVPGSNGMVAPAGRCLEYVQTAVPITPSPTAVKATTPSAPP